MLFLCAVQNSYSAAPVYQNEPSSTFLRNWLLCGPFPNPAEPYDKLDREKSGFYIDYLASNGRESALRVQTGQKQAYGSEEAVWFEHESPSDVVDLDSVITRSPFVLAYAYCEIESAEDTPCFIGIGSNDGVRAWFNGEEILDVPERRGVKTDDDLIPLVLKKGRNTLLLKIAETDNRWGFCCRLLPFQNQMLEKTNPFFKIRTNREGKADLVYFGSLSLIDKVIQRVDLQAVSSHDTQKQVWSRQWPGSKDTAIEIDPSRYDEYLMNVTMTLHDGSQRTMALPFAVGIRENHELFSEGKSDYSIVVGSEASESERWAAKELQHWLREIGGVELPIRMDTEPQETKEIVIGYNRHSHALLVKENIREPEMDDESFTYRSIGSSVAIWGGKTRGSMYGVFSFLENELGCRWYTPAVSVIPKRDSYRFHYLYHTEAPGIQVRNDFYHEAFDSTWAARNKGNGAMSVREQPGGVEGYWSVHTFFPLVPPEEYYATHPEYYSLIDGKRIYERAQLCLTNPDVLRIVTERILEKIRQNPQYLIYCVSQNDWAGPCQCDNCQAIAKREESESGPVVWFVNQVAEAVEKEFPEKYIGTLAYQYTRKPCKTLRPRNNVVIRLCSIECCFAHDFQNCPENKSFVEDIQKWSAIAPKMYIWDYVVNFSHYIMPYPNFRVLQPNIQFFRDHNVIGIMEQGAYQSRGGEFAELRAYVLAKLLWHPNADVQKIIDDFMSGYYGRSGQYVREYLDLLHNQLTADTHIHLGLLPDDRLFTDEFVEKAEQVFDQAETVADTEEIRKRVEVARLPIFYLKCRRNPQLAIQDGTYARFNEIVQREGITHYAESGPPHREMFHTFMDRFVSTE